MGKYTYIHSYIFFTTIALQNEKDAGMAHCKFTFTFISSLPCLSFFGMLSPHLLMICLFLYDYGFMMKQFAIQFQKLATLIMKLSVTIQVGQLSLQFLTLQL